MAEWLEEDILSIRLVPGQELSATSLAARFGASQPQVKSALAVLQKAGLVSMLHPRQVTVSKIDLDSARHSHFLRLGVEQEAVRRICQHPAPAVAALNATFLPMREAALAKDIDAFLACDQLFHRTILVHAGAPDLWDLVQANSGHLTRIRRLRLTIAGTVEACQSDLRALTDAIGAGDTERAVGEMHRHIAQAYSIDAEVRQRYPDYFVGTPF